MLDQSEQFTLEDAKKLSAWTRAWYDEAIARNFLRPPYHPDEAMRIRLRCYFHAGLSPAEAAQACFGRKH